MHYAYRFRLKPTAEQRELLDYHRDTCRQLYKRSERLPRSPNRQVLSINNCDNSATNSPTSKTGGTN